MSFQRRWFLTAAGSAFLASIGGVLEAAQATKTTPGPRFDLTGDPDKDLPLLMKSFESGYGGPLDKKPYDLCAGFLRTTYSDRYVLRFPKLDPGQKAHLEGFAATLGRLVKLNQEREDLGICGWTKSPKPDIRTEHLVVARDQVGFYLNGNIGAAKRCKNTAPIRTKENDEPCPLCQI